MPPSVDPKGAFKAPTFSGKRDDFGAWVFQMESYAGLLGWEKYFTTISTLQAELDEDLIEEEQKEVSRTLYYLLVTTCRGPALSIVNLTTRGCGLESMRRLYRDYRTGLHEDHATMLAAILTPTWWGERSRQLFTDVLVRWDELIAT